MNLRGDYACSLSLALANLGDDIDNDIFLVSVAIELAVAGSQSGAATILLLIISLGLRCTSSFFTLPFYKIMNCVSVCLEVNELT